jgi:hypothetical protein
MRQLCKLADEFCLRRPGFGSARVRLEDLTPRRGLVYDADRLEGSSPSLSRADVMKARRTLQRRVNEGRSFRPREVKKNAQDTPWHAAGNFMMHQRRRNVTWQVMR